MIDLIGAIQQMRRAPQDLEIQAVILELLRRDVVGPLIKGSRAQANRVLDDPLHLNDRDPSLAVATFFLGELLLQEFDRKYLSESRETTFEAYLRQCLGNLIRAGSNHGLPVDSGSRRKTATRAIRELLLESDFKLRMSARFSWYIPQDWSMETDLYTDSLEALSRQLPILIDISDPIRKSACRAMVDATFAASLESHQQPQFIGILALQHAFAPHRLNLIEGGEEWEDQAGGHLPVSPPTQDDGLLGREQLEIIKRELHCLGADERRLLRRFLELASVELTQKTTICRQLAPEFNCGWTTLNYRLERKLFPRLELISSQMPDLSRHELRELLQEALAAPDGEKHHD